LEGIVQPVPARKNGRYTDDDDGLLHCNISKCKLTNYKSLNIGHI